MNNRSKRGKKGTEFDFFTGAKKASFATYYNIAWIKTSKIIEDSEPAIKEFEIGNLDALSEKTYAKLKNYIWKGFDDAKNKSGVPLTDNDIEIIKGLIRVLHNIRNFHSHYYHHNKALILNDQLRKFVSDKYEEAKNTQYQTKNHEFVDFNETIRQKKLKIIDTPNGNYYLTQYGRIFFLSFFISRQDMYRMIEQRMTEDKKIKVINDHAVFKNIMLHFTWNERAIRFKFNHENNVLSNLPSEHQDEVLRIRQVYKILNYLKNSPMDKTDPEKYPIIYKKEDTKTENEKTENEKKEDTKAKVAKADDLIKAVSNARLFADFSITKETILAANQISIKTSKGDDAYDKYEKEVICWKHNSYANKVMMDVADFHRCVLYAINKTDFIQVDGGEMIEVSCEKHIANKIKEYIEARANISTILQKVLEGLGNDEEKTEKFWNEQTLFWKGLPPEPERILKTYLTKIYQNKAVKDNQTTKTKKLLLQDAQVRFIDLFVNTQHIIRRQNEFCRFVIQYFMNHNIMPEWEWQQVTYSNEYDPKTEKYVNIKKRTYSNTVLNNHSIGLDKLMQAVVKFEEKLFVINPKVLKILILAHLDKKKKDSKFDEVLDKVKTYFIDAKDDEKDERWASDRYRPRHLKTQENTPYETLESFREKLAKRIELRLKEYKSVLELMKQNKLEAKRSEKNEMIMEVYKLYEWKYKDGTKKFLRRNEYNLMSTYHYSMEVQLLKPLLNEKSDIFSRMPRHICELLNEKKSLNKLLNEVLILGINKLGAWHNNVQKIKEVDENWEMKGRKFNIKYKKFEGQANTNIPYVLHPMQVLYILYPDETKNFNLGLAKKVFGKESKEGKPHFPDKWTDGLMKTHYDIDGYLALKQQGQRVKKGLIGKMDKMLTEDIILFELAKRYYSSASQTFIKHNVQINSVYNIRNSKIKIPVELSSGDRKRGFSVEIACHRLDDFLFSENLKTTELMVAYFVRLYNLNNGQTIDYTDLMNDYKFLHKNAMAIAEGLLYWEKEQVDDIKKKLGDKRFTELANEEVRKKGGMERLSFKQVIKNGDIGNDCTDIKKIEAAKPSNNENEKCEGVSLREIRNSVFHSKIPKEYTYPELLKDNLVYRIVKPEAGKVKPYCTPQKIKEKYDVNE